MSDSPLALQERAAGRGFASTASEAALELAGARLRAGRLVAFPTETVYGLGANALDAHAVACIYAAKGRPASDPLIVHVPDVDQGLSLVTLPDKSLAVFRALATAFWPGPLTLVARARDCVPPEVTARTGFVGIRVPAHPVARAMLLAAGVPVAAPSANRFGHVSPTLAEHVLADLSASDVMVLGSTLDSGEGGPCEVGIESTVAKVEAEEGKITLFRRGGVPEDALAEALRAAGVEGVDIVVVSKAAKPADGDQQAPGQLLTHYAPDVPTFVLAAAADSPVVTASDAVHALHRVRASGHESGDSGDSGGGGSGGGGGGGGSSGSSGAVVIDFGGQLAELKESALAYRDLSSSGDVRGAARELFDALRWSEQQEGAKAVLLADVWSVRCAHTAALADRMFRAASGNAVDAAEPGVAAAAALAAAAAGAGAKGDH